MVLKGPFTGLIRPYTGPLHFVVGSMHPPSGVLVEDVVGNMMEAMCSMLFMKGDDYPRLHKCLEVSDQKYEVLEGM